MKSKANFLLLFLAVLACAVAAYWFFAVRDGRVKASAGEDEVGGAIVDSDDGGETGDAEDGGVDVAEDEGDPEGEGDEEAVDERTPEEIAEERASEEEERLVDEFDALTDEFREPVDSEKGITMEQIRKFHEKFGRIPDGRKEECLQRALNLVPDDNVMLLAGILMDKTQPQEYLELVFNDILNREETAKQAILEQVYADKEHPCWADAAWILDATGATPGAGDESLQDGDESSQDGDDAESAGGVFVMPPDDGDVGEE